MAEKLHVGIIGSGGMTKNHSRGYLNSGQYEIVALADLSSEVMNEYDKVFSEYDDYKAQHFTDFREMLQWSCSHDHCSGRCWRRESHSLRKTDGR